MPASRSLIALLVGTVVFFALWVFALKGGGSNNSSKGGLGQYQSDINAAHKAVTTENASNAASGNENAATSSGGATASTGAAKATSNSASTSDSSAKAATSRKSNTTVTVVKTHPQSAAVTLSAVQAAVTRHKVVALLFYNPSAADDQAVKQELGSVPTHRGAVVKLAVPVSEAASFTAVTQQVPLNLSPTLVLISKTDQASEIVGYTDSFEIDQRIDDALAAG